MIRAAVILFALGAIAAEAAPQRIVSLNLCTDQLLIDLAEPRHIVGLSPYARDTTRAFEAARATTLPTLSGTAEEVMVIAPDLVVSSRYMKRETRQFIAARGLKLVEFDDPRTLAEARAQIAEMGRLLGAEERASQRLAAFDSALADLRDAARKSILRILPLARRGWVAGSETLIADLLREGGLMNVAGELGFKAGGFASLEAVIALKPDALLLTRSEIRAEDQGQALLLHPAIQTLFPAEKRITISERLTVCGGPMLTEAMRQLTREIKRLGR
ncbi:MAG: ABC transporter substrate-binding protein [Rhabdaerophilum sp.]